MSLHALRIALQGLFPLSPLALAVQGLLGVGAEPPTPQPEPAQTYRPPVVGRSPGTTINASAWLEALRQKSKTASPAQPPAPAPSRRTNTSTKRRREEEALHLAAAML